MTGLRGVRDAVFTPQFADRRETYMHALKIPDGPCTQLLKGCLQRAAQRTLARGAPPDSYLFVNDSPELCVIAGSIMEQETALLEAAHKELSITKQTLQELANEIRAVHDIVAPQLLAQAQSLRSARMTVVADLREAMTALRDVRKFFLESDYAVEMARLERYVALCRELQVLQQQGVLDAVSDVAIKLALRVPS